MRRENNGYEAEIEEVFKHTSTLRNVFYDCWRGSKLEVVTVCVSGELRDQRTNISDFTKRRKDMSRRDFWESCKLSLRGNENL